MASSLTLLLLLLLSGAAAAALDESQPTLTYFEVDRPLRPPPGSAGPCSARLLSASFGATYGRPPATAAYAPPACLAAAAAGGGSSLALAVLEWSASCRGRQVDRVFGVWPSGAELLRGCTADAWPFDVRWSVSRDVTRYAALLARPGELAVHLGNVVDATNTGVYHANLTLHLYFHTSPAPPPPPPQPADLILPVSGSLPLNDGQWFAVRNATDVQSKTLAAVPPNAYRAVLEVDYTRANNLTAAPGNGAFREVVATVDGEVVGAVWPFTVIYTGGINPVLWRPITGVGSFSLPTYDIDITPFLGKLLDGEAHDFGFSVTNALDVWYIDANLHLWLDHRSDKTTGGLISHDSPGLKLIVHSQFIGLDGQFVTSASRRFAATGWVKSSYGEVTTTFSQRFGYQNSNVYRSNGTVQVVNQTIDARSSIVAKDASSAVVLLSQEVHQVFPLYVYTATTDQVGDEFSVAAFVRLGVSENRASAGELGFSYSSLQNSQSARGSMKVKKHLLVGGLGMARQVYRHVGTEGCYFRDVSSRNYTILFDHSDESCPKEA
ncbi:hypothetical protein ACP4OV_011060 [Aristida adscensionis]